MTTTLIALTRSGPEPHDNRPSVSLASSGVHALDETMIADLSPGCVARMQRDELMRVVESARLPLLRPEVRQHLRHMDLESLRKLAHLAQRCCQKRLADSLWQSSAGTFDDDVEVTPAEPPAGCW